MTKAAHSGATHEKAGDAQRAPAERDLREPEGLADVGQELTHAPHDLIGRRASLLTDPRLRGGVGQRAQLMRQIQRSGGNSFAERLLERHAAPPIVAPLQREEEGGEDRTPTEAEKKAALQAAAAAEQLAIGSKAKGADQVGQVVAAKAGERAAGQAASQQSKAALGAAKVAAQQGRAAKKAGALAGKAALALLAITPKPEAAAPAEPGKAPAAAEQDPAFQGVVAKVRGIASRKKAHPAAKSKAAAAQAAAESPAAELSGQAQGKQAGKMQAAEAPAFDKAAFKAKLMERIAALAPKTTKEADEFKKSDRLGGVKGEMQGSVAEEQAQSAGPTQEATAADPATNPTEPKAVAPLQEEGAGAPPGDIGGGAAAPKPKTAAEVEQPMQVAAKGLDQQMAEEDISEQQLREGNEPEFQGALDAKGEAKDHAKAGPQEFRQAERGQIAQAKAEAGEITASQAHEMHQARGGALKGIAGKQKATKSRDEQERAQVGERIQGIYNETKTAVTAKLGGLDAKVTQAFDTGAAAAKKTFEDYVDAKMTAYKEDRYGGWFGWARWAKDKIAGMPSKVNAFYTEGRALYLREMDAVIDRVSTIVVTTLNEARAEVARGRQRIQEYVATLPEKLKGVGSEAAEQTQSQFDELEGQISSKLDETINGLATKYSENLKAVDARIEDLKAANQGLVQKAANAIAGVIKTILQLKDMLLGVLARAAGVIGTIIKSPIKFLSNLIGGVKQGLSQFVDNIGTHLKNGLMTWLFGELAAGGIELPKSFDIKGILTLVMQVLGLTWQSIRAQAVKILGEPVVKTLEGAFDIFMILKEQGLGGLWEFIKDKLSDLKDMVIDGIKDMVATEVIKAGVQWLVGLLGGPAGAFIKAAKAIIDIVMWFVNNGSRVMALVNSVLDSVSAIASGSLGQAANFIEQSLAKAVPVMIGFLASLLGLGNLGGKIKAIIERVQAPVKKAIGWVLGKAKGFAAKATGMAKALGGKVKGALGIKDKPPEQRLKEGLSLGVSAVNKLKGKPMVGEAMLRPILSGIRGLKGLSVLEPFQKGTYWAVRGDVQRSDDKERVSEVKAEDGEEIMIKGIPYKKMKVEGGIRLFHGDESRVLSSSRSVNSMIKDIVEITYGPELAKQIERQLVPRASVDREGVTLANLPEEAQDAIEVLKVIGLAEPRVLISFASKETGDPEKTSASKEPSRRGKPEVFLRDLMAGDKARRDEKGRPYNPMAAFDKPATREEREKAVARGQEEGESILSDTGLVFKELFWRQYTPSASGTSGATVENLVRGRGGKGYVPAPVEPLGIVRVNDQGVIVEIIELFGSIDRTEFKMIMETAGWGRKIAPNL